MADQEQLEMLKSGVDAWNKWRSEHLQLPVDLSGARLIAADLSGADLSDANLSRAVLTHAKLNGAILNSAKISGAELSGADLNCAALRRTDLSGTKLRRASLRDSYLRGANLCGADLTGANLTQADLQEVNLSVANLRGADLSGAHLLMTIFGFLDLRQLQGLDSCVHGGPSTVDYYTLMQSGPLPLSFLRGCGFSGTFIEYLPSLLGTAIDFYSCFISYSTDDQAFAERLHADLQDNQVRCWFAPHDIKSGRKVHEQIDEAIRLYDKLLLILSDGSMQSEWVKTEIAHARQKEVDDQRRVLFPISIVPFETIKAWKNFDADTGKDSAREIREYYVPDFSNWKDHDAYKLAFDRLLRDLRAPEANTSGSGRKAD